MAEGRSWTEGLDSAMARLLARLSGEQLVRLVATCDAALARLGAPSAPAPGLDELRELEEERLRGLLPRRLATVFELVRSMAVARGSQADYESLLEAARQGAEALGFNYREAIFELHSLLPFWQGGATRSGEGSTLEATAALRSALPGLLARHGVRTLLDAPCGDFHWARHVEWGDVRYAGVDIVADIVESNRERYGPLGFTFHHADVARDPLPEACAILCRDCLFHFSVEDVFRTLANFKRSGARLLLTSTFPGLAANRAIVTGHFHPINLQIEPYGLPEPLELVPDAPLDKALGVWRLSDVPDFTDSASRSSRTGWLRS